MKFHRGFYVLSSALTVLVMVATLVPQSAGAEMERAKREKYASRKVHVPVTAEIDGVVPLGFRIDPASQENIEGFAIIHRDKRIARARSGSVGGSATNACYGFFASGAKWKSVEPWVFNTTNTRGIDGSGALSAFSAAISRWEDAGDGVLGNGKGVNILGDGTRTDALLVADEITIDGINEVYFADVDSPGTIAVTIVWGIFSGPTKNRKLVEWDQIYDETDYDWSLSGEDGAMDLENIATHELGHSIGLKDLYTTSCNDQTMYGYAEQGETKKRSLGVGDVTGTNILY